ncbi:type II and III secretion system protein [bacterium]|nr:type II and III secretion system protein [bacterium]MBU1936113.1 type II and III secretion system protein [bacterium]
MKHTWLIGFLLVTGVGMLWAADKPPRSYTPAEQIVTLSAELPLREAFEILSDVAMTATGKTILDPANREQPIGVDIFHRYWRDALEILLARNQLWYLETAESFFVFRPKVGRDGKPLFIPSGAEDPTRVTADTREVKIEAVFFEGDRKTLREFGINWSSLVDGKLFIQTDGTAANELSNSIFSISTGGSGTRGGTQVDVEALMRTLESLDKGQIIARPEVTVANRKTGRIQVGQDFSVRSVDFAGNTVEQFYSAGTILEVIPILVFGEERPYIHLDIHAERSTVVPSLASTIVNKTQTETEVLLYDGEQTAIGGLYVTQNTTIRKGIPYVKDLPWWVFGLRYLFGYSRDETETRELVILMRAHLVEDASTRFSKRNQLEESRRKDFEQMQNRFK